MALSPAQQDSALAAVRQMLRGTRVLPPRDIPPDLETAALLALTTSRPHDTDIMASRVVTRGGP
jgi:hypothetical protein